MTFPEALKLLAEKRPEMFLWREEPTTKGPICRFVFNHRNHWVDRITQDDIDDIAALLGWEYDVYRFSEKGYASTYRQNGTIGKPQPDGDWLYNNVVEIHATKLEAAKAALIAIIETSPRKD